MADTNCTRSKSSKRQEPGDSLRPRLLAVFEAMSPEDRGIIEEAARKVIAARTGGSK